MAELEAFSNCHTPPAKKARADDAVPQKSWTVKQLKDVLRTRGGRLSGKRDKLYERCDVFFIVLLVIVKTCCRFLMNCIQGHFLL